MGDALRARAEVGGVQASQQRMQRAQYLPGQLGRNVRLVLATVPQQRRQTMRRRAEKPLDF